MNTTEITSDSGEIILPEKYNFFVNWNQGVCTSKVYTNVSEENDKSNKESGITEQPITILKEITYNDYNFSFVNYLDDDTFSGYEYCYINFTKPKDNLKGLKCYKNESDAITLGWDEYVYKENVECDSSKDSSPGIIG